MQWFSQEVISRPGLGLYIAKGEATKEPEATRQGVESRREREKQDPHLPLDNLKSKHMYVSLLGGSSEGPVDRTPLLDWVTLGERSRLEKGMYPGWEQLQWINISKRQEAHVEGERARELAEELRSSSKCFYPLRENFNFSCVSEVPVFPSHMFVPPLLLLQPWAQIESPT